jgi:hypothetical protein
MVIGTPPAFSDVIVQAVDAGTNALREYRIDEQRYSVELYEPASVAEPGETRRLTDGGWASQQGNVRVDARRGCGDVIATAAAKHFVDDCPLQDCRLVIVSNA